MGKKSKKTDGTKIVGVIFMGSLLLGAFGYFFFQPYTNAEDTNISSTEHFSASASKIAEEKLLEQMIQVINTSKENYETNFDFETDSSLQKYISKAKPLDNVTYVPADLEEIDTSYIVNKLYHPQLRSPARKAFEKMAKDFYDEFGEKLILVSAYRSYESQKRLIDKGCSLTQCAVPGTSEHQLGLAVDIHVENENGLTHKLNKQNNKYYQRLDQNAHKYGFHNTYKIGLHTDEEIKIKEYRHRRYCSIPVATFLYENDLTIGEYVELEEKPKIIYEPKQKNISTQETTPKMTIKYFK